MTASNPLTQTQVRRNADSAGTWDFAASHRNQVTRLLTERKSAEHPQLCVLGAGNCNDLELSQLCSTFDQIDLFDIDQAAMMRGLTAQDCQPNDSLRLHGECDVTGIWDRLAQLKNLTAENTAAENGGSIDQLLGASASWPGLAEVGTYGTVASACLLSQLVDGAIATLGESHPRCLELITAIRQRHLQLLYELTGPGGQAILITDFVSSDTAPTLPTLSGQALSNTLMQMIQQQNFFTGLNPLRIEMLLHQDAFFVGRIEGIRCEHPWLWNFGPRHYAVTAISFKKLAAAA